MNFCSPGTSDSFYAAATLIAVMPVISVLMMHFLESSAILVLIKSDIAPWLRERLESHAERHSLPVRLIEASVLGLIFVLFIGFYGLVLFH